MVNSVRQWSSDIYSRVVVDVSGEVTYDSKRLENPDRLYIDIHGSVVVPDACGSVKVSDGLLRGIRTAQYDDDTVRVVLDLGSMESYKIFTLDDPSRLVIDIYGKTVSQPAPVFSAKRIVLDPGHGGKDPGAMRGGVKEKNVVLDIAKRVKLDLEKKGYEVVLTRDSDKYLSLEERTVLANKKQADLFVSIHVNANNDKRVSGLETYLLNFTDNEEANRVAARENKISVRRMQQARSELGVILASLELQNKRDESVKLANYVQEAVVSTIGRRYRGVRDNGVRQALFYVLVGARMPSILVETSYITNNNEGRRLRSATYRTYLAHGIAKGIEDYFEGISPVQRVAKR
jgi:N-acetylmuramoyl-L-alanine amidase